MSGNPKTCIFDEIIVGNAPAHVVLAEAELIGFLDTRPVFPGHTLIVPRVHFETVSDLPAPLLGALWEAGRRVSAAQRVVLGAEGTFFGVNDVVSQSVPHLHLHVVPRRRKDGLRGFFWPRTRYATDAEAADLAGRLREALGVTAVAGAGKAGEAAAAAPPRVRVRGAVPADAQRVAELLAGGNLRASEDPGDPEPYRRAIEAIAADPPGAVLVAEVDGRPPVVGVCQMIVFRHLQERGGLCAELESVHVAEGQRSMGVGAALVAEALDRARRAGCYRMQLTSNKVRLDAHRFWARQGFTASHEGFKLYL